MTATLTRTATPARSPGRMVARAAAIAVGALALACSGGAQAQGHFHGGGYYHGGGWGFGPVLGFGLGLGLASAYYYDRPDYVYYAPPPVTVYTTPAPAPVVVSAPAPAADPIFYPRNGQNAQQTEADRQACNSWATSQPRAMADAAVFQRATLACMDGRGYTAR